MRSTLAHTMVLAVSVLGGSGSILFAQEVPWDVYVDSQSDVTCDAVNAGNLEVVVFSGTGRLVVITGADYTLPETAYVDERGIFIFEGLPLGQIAFADDGNGFRTLWLLDLGNNVMELDPDTGEPIFTNLVPDDFLGVPCDAFELWDDDDFDDVPDEDDDCPVDFGDYRFGCPCEVFDDDADAVNNCFDECPNTHLNSDVDEVGCEIVIVVVDPPPVTVIPPPITFVCGNFSTLTLAMTFGALVGFRLVRRRYS